MGATIRLGERIRWPKRDAWWNHVAVVVDPYPDGTARIVQAIGKGVVYSPLDDLEPDHVVCLPLDAFPSLTGHLNRDAVVAQAHALVGAKYGWLTILSIVANLLTPKWVRIPALRRGATFICSAAGAYCLLAGGAQIDTYDLYQVFPAELASWASDAVLY